MIFTNCGLLGDMFLCLPVLSWYYKTHTEKVTFALATHFPYSRDAEELLRMQECIEDVIYFDYVPKNYDMGAQPYHINSSTFDDEETISLGFQCFPNKYLPAFYAEEYGLGVDYDFVLNYGEPDLTYRDDVVKVDKWENPKLNHVDAIPLTEGSMLKNVQYAAGAKQCKTFTTGFSIMATLAKIPITLYEPSHLHQHHQMYFDINGGIEWKTI